MKKLIKPKKLNPGDKVALVSLSWGGAGDETIRWRYEQGKSRLKTVFGLEPVEMAHTLAGTQYIYDHPEARAADLMAAFANPDIKAIIACIGGIESIRMLPYLDFDIMRKNPKIFLGYSDSTTTHLFCFKSGISSIYGPTLLVDFAENIAMHDYTVDYLKKTLFKAEPVGVIDPASNWTSVFLPWEETNKDTARQMSENKGPMCIQGKGKVRGHLIGGCIEVLAMLRGTSVFPNTFEFHDAILFLETSEDKPPAWFVECELRAYGVMGILQHLGGIIFGKPQDEMHFDAYQAAILKVLKEYNRTDLPVLYNLNFGHTEPKFCLPYGALAEIDCESVQFSLLESAVLPG